MLLLYAIPRKSQALHRKFTSALSVTFGATARVAAPSVCFAAAGLDSGALPFPRHRALLVQTKADRYANGSPSGGAGERSETERARMLPNSSALR